MSSFTVEIVKVLDVKNHPNADRLSLVTVKGYTCIANKLDDGYPRYKIGDHVVYIPESSLLPTWLLKRMNLWKDDKGSLAGSGGNRVKAIKLRGIFSLGLLYPLEQIDDDFMLHGELNKLIFNTSPEGMDVKEFLNITKYEPPIPISLAGEVSNFGMEYTIKYDIENYRNYPDIFKDGEEVVFYEKLHGSNLCFGIVPEHLYNDDFINKKFFVTSKGLGASGLILKDNDANKSNSYLNTVKKLKLPEIFKDYDTKGEVMLIFGEMFGGNIQDLKYGQTDPVFRVFDVYIGTRSNGLFLNDYELDVFCLESGLCRVPLLYKGPFSKSVVEEYTQGKETVTGAGVHMREGIVMRPTAERIDFKLGRVQLKSISEEYLLRKNGTEFN